MAKRTSPPARAAPTEAEMLDLTVALETLAEEVHVLREETKVLRQTLDEIRDDVGWVINNKEEFRCRLATDACLAGSTEWVDHAAEETVPSVAETVRDLSQAVDDLRTELVDHMEDMTSQMKVLQVAIDDSRAEFEDATRRARSHVPPPILHVTGLPKDAGADAWKIDCRSPPTPPPAPPPAEPGQLF